MEHLHKYFTIDNRAEITLEANPDDLTPDKSEELSRTPINRLSIGIQSFFDEDLKWMNRAHNSLQASSAVKNAQDKGFENITIDLIYGTPTLSNENWTENLQRTFDLKIKHISAYCLTIEPKTVLGHQLKNKMIKSVDEQKSAMQFEKMLVHSMAMACHYYPKLLPPMYIFFRIATQLLHKALVLIDQT